MSKRAARTRAITTAWTQAWNSGLRLEAPPVEPILERYDEPQRHYHTRRHVFFMLQSQRMLGFYSPNPLVTIATVLHDAVYDIGAQDNELRSARLSDDILYETGHAWLAEEVNDLILATEFRAYGKPPKSLNEAIVRDSDLAGFVDLDVCMENSRKVRDEFVIGASIPLDVYEPGRVAFLRSMLALDQIFWSPAALALGWEVAARANILHEIVNPPS